jgi:hypothetical protein
MLAKIAVMVGFAAAGAVATRIRNGSGTEKPLSQFLDEYARVGRLDKIRSRLAQDIPDEQIRDTLVDAASQLHRLRDGATRARSARRPEVRVAAPGFVAHAEDAMGQVWNTTQDIADSARQYSDPGWGEAFRHKLDPMAAKIREVADAARSATEALAGASLAPSQSLDIAKFQLQQTTRQLGDLTESVEPLLPPAGDR